MSKEKYLVNSDTTPIPDYGLGAYKEGYSNIGEGFPWLSIFWNIIPVAGQFIFFTKVFQHFRKKGSVLIYENGFLEQHANWKGEIKEEYPYNFNELKGVSLSKTKHFQTTYGIRTYNGTAVDLSVMENDSSVSNILKGMYRNKNERPDKYNFIGYASHAINDAWINFAIRRFNQEFAQKGYGTFYADYKTILVGKGYIKVNDDIFSGAITYSFDNGYLYLYPETEEGAHFKKKSKPIEVNVAKMFNKEVFLMAIDKFLGIR